MVDFKTKYLKYKLKYLRAKQYMTSTRLEEVIPIKKNIAVDQK